MLIALVNMGMSITDAAMVSVLFGADALAAVAVGSDLYSILFYLGAGTLAGLSPFYAAAVVRADPTERVRLERIGQVAVALLAAVLVPVLWTAPEWLGALGLDPALLDQGRGYTQVMALTLVPMLGVAFYRTILTAAEKPKVFLWVTLAMLPVNAAANYVLMTGAGPAPDFGPTGAALATLLVATMSLLILALVARRSRPRGMVASAGPAVDWSGLASVLRVGLPIGIATVAEVGVFLGATIYAATLSAADVAAHTLALRTAGVAYAVPTALLQAAMIRMARAETLGDPAIRRAVTASGLGLALVAGAILFGALTLGARPLGRRLLRRRRGRPCGGWPRGRAAHAPWRHGALGRPGFDSRRSPARTEGYPCADALHPDRTLGGRGAPRPLPLRGAGSRHHRRLDRSGRRHAALHAADAVSSVGGSGEPSCEPGEHLSSVAPGGWQSRGRPGYRCFA